MLRWCRRPIILLYSTYCLAEFAEGIPWLVVCGLGIGQDIDNFHQLQTSVTFLMEEHNFAP